MPQQPSRPGMVYPPGVEAQVSMNQQVAQARLQVAMPILLKLMELRASSRFYDSYKEPPSKEELLRDAVEYGDGLLICTGVLTPMPK